MKVVQQLTKRLEDMEPLDRFADLAQRVISRLVPQESVRKDLLSGTWLGKHSRRKVIFGVLVRDSRAALGDDLRSCPGWRSCRARS
jgi:hypothetical protein